MNDLNEFIEYLYVTGQLDQKDDDQDENTNDLDEEKDYFLVRK